MEMFLLSAFSISVLGIITLVIIYVCLVTYTIKREIYKRMDKILTCIEGSVLFCVVVMILTGIWIELM